MATEAPLQDTEEDYEEPPNDARTTNILNLVIEHITTDEDPELANSTHTPSNGNPDVWCQPDPGQPSPIEQQVSEPSSPKAKSAPATPCNVTPTAFHQHTSHLSALVHPSTANTLPPDIRKNISATCRVLPSSIGAAASAGAFTVRERPLSPLYLDELAQRAESLLSNEDFQGAINFYSKCIQLATDNKMLSYLRDNFKLYGQRGEAHFKLSQYHEAIEDSRTARELNPKWTQAYYLQGQAQFMLKMYADAFAAFAYGLAQEPTNVHWFDTIVEAALQSDLRPEFEPKYERLKSAKLHQSPCVVVSVLGQELLAGGSHKHAAVVLESALKMGSDNQRFMSSILSSVAYAFYALDDYDKAIGYMQRELDIERELGDATAQCRVLSNLGLTYYKMRKFDRAIEAHRQHVTLAMRSHLFTQAAAALTALGRVHSARNDFASALTSHSRCLEILKMLDDNDALQCRELLSIGHIHAMMSDYKLAEDKYNDITLLLNNRPPSHSDKLDSDERRTLLVMLHFNIAYLALRRHQPIQAKQYYELANEHARTIESKSKRHLFCTRVSNAISQLHRLFKNFDDARECFDAQLHRFAMVAGADNATAANNGTGNEQAPNGIQDKPTGLSQAAI